MDKVPGGRGPAERTTISAPGPTNRELDAANPDSGVPPLSDTGSMPVFKYPFSLANKRVYKGGWSREVTARELPIAKELAGVNMRLEAGGIRELHWHKAAEWSIMLYGAARITAIDAEGRSFVRDVFEGDLWYFPTGIPHSIQGLGPDGAEFCWCSTTAISPSTKPCCYRTSWRTRRARSCRKISAWIQARWREFRTTSFSFFRRQCPGRSLRTRRRAAGTLGPSSSGFLFSSRGAAPREDDERRRGPDCRFEHVQGIDHRRRRDRNCPPRRHARASLASECGRMAVLHQRQGPNDGAWYRRPGAHHGFRSRRRRLHSEKTLPHYIDNTGDQDLRYIEVFRSSRFQDLSLSEWLSHTPPELVMAHLNIDQATYEKIPGEKLVVLPR